MNLYLLSISFLLISLQTPEQGTGQIDFGEKVDSLLQNDFIFSKPEMIHNLLASVNAEDQSEYLRRLANALRSRNKYSEALKLVEYALSETVKNDLFEVKGKLLERKALLLKDISEYDLATVSALEALEIGQLTHNPRLLLDCNNILGIVHFEVNNLDQAKLHYQNALRVAEEQNWTSDQAKILNNMGLIFENLDQFDSARYYYEKVIALNQITNDSLTISIVSNNLAILYQLDKDYRKALEYSLLSVTIDEKRNDLFGLTYSLITTADSYRKLRLFDSAYYYSKRVFDIVQEINNYERKSKVAEVHYKVLRDMGEYEEALAISELMVSYKDSVFNTTTTKQINELQSKYEAEQKERQIANLALAKANAEAKRNAYLTVAIGIACLLVLVVFWFRYRIRKNRQLKEKEIQKVKSELSIYTHRLLEKSTRVEELNLELEKVRKAISGDCPAYHGSLDSLMQSTILTHDEWTNFKKLFLQVYPGFFTKLRENFPELTDTEERLFALTRLNLSTREIASMLGISADSVNKSRYRLRKKLNIDSEKLSELVASY